jgi:hypothetical protein
MARKSARRKSRKSKRRGRKSRRHRGGSGVAANAAEFVPEVAPQHQDDVGGDEAPVEETPVAQEGGKRRRRRKSRKSKRGGACGASLVGGKRKTRKQKGGKRKLNAFFKAMLDAKRSKAKSFKYKGKTYVGKKHHRLGMIYKKSR